MVPSLSDFIDIHIHILPGLDDGPTNMQESVAIARQYDAVGVRHVIATPHFLPGTAWSATKEQVLDTVDRLQEQLDELRIEVEIIPGMEIAFHGNLEARIFREDVLPLGGSGFYLIEPSFHERQDELIKVLHRLLSFNQRLILAHPERVKDFQRRPEVLKSLFECGLKIQINTGSILGYFGNRSRQLAETLILWECVDFLASDTHSIKKRTPLSTQEWSEILKRPYGAELLKTCIANTNRLLRNDLKSGYNHDNSK